MPGGLNGSQDVWRNPRTYFQSMSIHPTIDRARKVLKTHYEGAVAAFLGGDMMRETPQTTSELEMVVILTDIESPWRQGFDGQPFIDTRVHSPESLITCFEVERTTGIPNLISTIYEGLPLIPGPLSTHLGSTSARTLNTGPAPLSKEDIKAQRYTITRKILDLEAAQDCTGIRAIGAELLPDVFDLHRRGRGLWSARGKYIFHHLAEARTPLDHSLLEGFGLLFTSAYPGPALAASDTVLEGYGGRLAS